MRADSVLSVQCLQVGFPLTRRCRGSCKVLPQKIFFLFYKNGTFWLAAHWEWLDLCTQEPASQLWKMGKGSRDG